MEGKKTIPELARNLCTLKRVSQEFSLITCEIAYQGQTFTVAKATLTLPKGKTIVGEGIARKSHQDNHNEDCGYNIAVKRSLESIDKQLRRASHHIGHRFEG